MAGELTTAGSAFGPVGGAIGAGLDLFSSSMGAGAQAEQAMQDRLAKKRAAEEERRRFEARKAAYEGVIGRGQQDLGGGEKQFLETYAGAPTELEQVKKDILSGGTEAMKAGSSQMQSDLAQQGVRGGQAGTLLARGAGEMGRNIQKDVNQQVLEEAMQRRQAKGGYFGGKAQRGQAATYTTPTF